VITEITELQSLLMLLLLQYPDGESDSPFVFICQHPRQLVVKFPLRGKHKICEHYYFVTY